MVDTEKQFDEAADRADRYMDTGLSSERAWDRADPTGEIRKTQQELQRKIDSDVRRMGAQATHDVETNRRLAEIENIFDPQEREKALVYYRATQIAKKQIKERNF